MRFQKAIDKIEEHAQIAWNEKKHESEGTIKKGIMLSLHLFLKIKIAREHSLQAMALYKSCTSSYS